MKFALNVFFANNFVSFSRGKKYVFLGYLKKKGLTNGQAGAKNIGTSFLLATKHS